MAGPKAEDLVGCPPPAPPVEPSMDPEARDRDMAQMAKALGHPARIAIMRLLLRKPGCVCGAIVEELPLAQSTVSQHLKVLKEAGLIRGDIDGPRVSYCVEPNRVDHFKRMVRDL